MTNNLLTLDRDPLLACFHQWHDENESMASQINESIAALSEYQQQLEQWQSELENEQAQISHQSTEDGKLNCKIDDLNSDLNEARQQIGTLTTELLKKSDELRALEKSKALLEAEVDRLSKQTPPTPEAPSATSDDNGLADELKEMRAMLKQYAANQAQPAATQAPVESVAPGSVAAQFNKLRQQQSQNRPGNRQK